MVLWKRETPAHHHQPSCRIDPGNACRTAAQRAHAHCPSQQPAAAASHHPSIYALQRYKGNHRNRDHHSASVVQLLLTLYPALNHQALHFNPPSVPIDPTADWQRTTILPVSESHCKGNRHRLTALGPSSLFLLQPRYGVSSRKLWVLWRDGRSSRSSRTSPSSQRFSYPAVIIRILLFRLS